MIQKIEAKILLHAFKEICIVKGRSTLLSKRFHYRQCFWPRKWNSKACGVLSFVFEIVGENRLNGYDVAFSMPRKSKLFYKWSQYVPMNNRKSEG